jgi:thermitase
MRNLRVGAVLVGVWLTAGAAVAVDNGGLLAAPGEVVRELVDLPGELLGSLLEAPEWDASDDVDLLVGIRPGVIDGDVQALLADVGAVALDKLRSLPIFLVRVPRGLADPVMSHLALLPDVEFVEENALVVPDAIPNDPEYANGWHLPKIGMSAAWDVTQGSSSVVIAILDSGIAPTHEDMQGKLLPGWNLYDNNSNTTDLSGHGTRVAGVAAAGTNNGVGVSAVGWSSMLLPVRVTLPDGTAYLSTIANGLTWAADHGAKVMNVSFSGVVGSSAVRSAAQYVQSKGGVVVSSAGNCTCTDPMAENPYIISVGATDAVDAMKDFSSRGAYVDLAAPGVMIRTTRPEGDYSSVAGTSFSSPIVAGVVALMMAANPGATPGEIEAWLEETAKDLGPAGWDSAAGFGRVQADLAVAAAANAATSEPPADVTPPSASIQSPNTGSTLAGAATVEVVAFDDQSIAGVDLYADSRLAGHDTASPFSFLWDTRTVGDGGHELIAIATDVAGNQGSSTVVSVSTSNASDTTAPAVAITSPTNGSAIARNPTIAASAQDDSRVVRLDVLVDGRVIGGTACAASSCSASIRWNTNKAAKGTHRITAVATDAAGRVAASPAVSVTLL